MRRHLKALFRGQSLEDVAMFAMTGALITLAVVMSPVWVPFYVVGRVVVYLYDKKYE